MLVLKHPCERFFAHEPRHISLLQKYIENPLPEGGGGHSLIRSDGGMDVTEYAMDDRSINQI